MKKTLYRLSKSVSFELASLVIVTLALPAVLALTYASIAHHRGTLAHLKVDLGEADDAINKLIADMATVHTGIDGASPSDGDSAWSDARNRLELASRDIAQLRDEYIHEDLLPDIEESEAEARQNAALLWLLIGASGATLALVDVLGLISRRRSVALAKLRGDEQVRQAKSEFLATVTHELRTPLTCIIAFNDLLARDLDGRLNEREAAHLKLVSSNAENLKAQINNLVDVAGWDGSPSSFDVKEVDLARAVRTAVLMCAPLAERRHTSVQFAAWPPSIPVSGDAERLSRLIANLLDNALKFSPEGSVVHVNASVTGGNAVVTVKDEGPGMDKALIKRAFEPFFRGDNEVTRRAGGAGLGLTIARNIAREHGGTVTLESQPGKGVKATLHLPLRTPEVKKARAA
jgi:signal transduction histidine kinase